MPGASGRPGIKWNIGFFNTLASDLAAAKMQMNAYNASPGIKWISYMIINFDEFKS